MNILPKKRWHVRTKDNIARVRRDEAQAAEEEQKREAKLQLAESEARINYLRKKSGLPEHQHDPTPETRQESSDSAPTTATGHVDLFSDYKSHIQTTNKELEKEKKEEQEKYEKQIGYLTYLGQDTNEALKLRSWYEVAPKRSQVGDPEILEKDQKAKFSQDPLTLIHALLPPQKAEKRSVPKRPPTEVEPTINDEAQIKRPKKEKKSKKDKKKHKKHKKDRKASRYEREQEERLKKREKLERLRRERLKREAVEKERQEALLAPKTTERTEQPKTVATPRVVQKYNSQFNPELAKQNQI